MSWTRAWTWAGVLCLLGAAAVCAGQNQPAGDGSSGSATAAVAAVPRLIKFSGMVRDARGELLGSVAVRLTFAVYSEQQGGAALWAESQVAQLDEQGHYTVLLGATRADGLPVELFPAGKARWLGVQVEGRDEDSRVLLVSVPYALKAEDAAMLGGRQASDFVLGEQLKEEVRTQVAAQTPGIATQAVEMLVSNPPNLPAIAEGPSTFTCATTGDCVAVTQSGTGRALRTTATSASETVLVQQNGTGYGLRALSPGNVALLGQVTGSAGTSYGVKGQTTSTSGAGVFGYNLATTGLAYGILGQTASTTGTALFGRATATTGATIGLRGHADSTSGVGILGQATATSGVTTGLVARVFSVDGTALIVDNTKGGKLLSAQVNGAEKLSVSGSGNVSTSGSVTAASFSGNGSGLTNLTASYLYGAVSTTSSVVGVPGVTGTNTAAAGDTNGVYGLAASTAGTGVFGYASAGTGYTNGVYGLADSTDGTGVFGYASSTAGSTDGVYGESKSTEGAGVYGNASADSGESYGLYGEAQSTSGTGVLGYALSATGTTVGVAGKTGSSAGVAGLFDNLAGGSILLGQTNGTERFRVGGNGNVTASGNVTATSFVGPLTGAASDLNCTGCVAEAELGFSTATQAELDAEATLRAAADSSLQTGINNRVLKAGDTMTGTLNLPANGLKVGTSQLWAYNGNVGIGSAGMQDRSLFVWRTGVEDSASNYGLYVGNATTQATGSVSKYGALIAITGAVRGDNYGLDVKNDSTNTVTDGASKYGVRIISDTNFPGGAGTATRNWGLYVQTPMGADENYAAYFGGNVGIGTDTPAQALQVSGNGNFSGSVTATSFVGALTGTATDLNCTGCVAPSEVSFNYAASASQGGAATSALAATTATTASDATNLGGVAASNFARRDTVNTFTDTQTISSGNLNLPATAGSSVGVIKLGGSPFAHGYGAGNTFLGVNAGNFTTTGVANTASGAFALYHNTTGGYNTATGNNALNTNTEGNYNTASGESALFSNTAGSANTANGNSALQSNTSGFGNTASGAFALQYNTTAGGNVALGHYALYKNCSGVATDCYAVTNTAVGYYAGVTSNEANANVTGANNTFLGASSGPGTSTQLSNATAIGANALVSASNALVLGSSGVSVGIGTQSPTARLEVVDGDVYASTAGKGVIVKSPDGTKCARIGIDNSGALSVTTLTCP